MDSRRESRSFFKEQKWKPLTRVQWFVISFLTAISASMFLMEEGMTFAMQNVLFLVVFAVMLWLTEAIPPYIVGIVIIIGLVWLLGAKAFIDEPMPTQRYADTWASPIIFLMLGGFFLAEGLKKTKLDTQLFKMSISLFGNTPKMVLLGMMLITALLSMIMSNTATTAMMIAAVLPFVRTLQHDEPLKKSLLLGIPAAAAVGGMGTIIGTPPNAIAVQFLEESKGIDVNFVQWIMYGLPVAIVLIIFFWFVLMQVFKTKLTKVILSIEPNHAFSKEEKQKRVIMIVVLIITVLLWLTSPFHGLNSASVATVPILVLSLTGIIKAKEFKSLPWDTLALVAGGLSLGAAIMDVGLAKFYLDKVSMNPMEYEIPFFILIGLLTVVFSNIMSNTATSSIMIPIACTLFPSKCIETSLIVGLCASCALMLPVSTPPNAIAFSTEMLEQKDFRLGGLVIGLLGPLVVISWVLLVV